MTSLEKRIRDYILHSAAPCERLTERTLASRLNVTRAQVREALLALEGSGVLRRQPQRGYSYVHYGSDDLDIARYLRYFIEHEAIQMVRGKVSAPERTAIEQILAQLDEAARERDFRRFTELETAFHTALVALSHDNLLVHLFDYVQMVAFSSVRETETRFTAHAEYYFETQRQHHALFAAICAGDVASARALLTSHIHAAGLSEWLARRFSWGRLVEDAGVSSRRGRPPRWSGSLLERAREEVARLPLDTPGLDALAVRLQTIHGLTGEELATLFGVSPSTIDRFLHNYRQNHENP